MQKLPPEPVNRLIAKIVIFDSCKDENGKKHFPLKIHFAGACVIQPSDSKMIRKARKK